MKEDDYKVGGRDMYGAAGVEGEAAHDADFAAGMTDGPEHGDGAEQQIH